MARASTRSTRKPPAVPALPSSPEPTGPRSHSTLATPETVDMEGVVQNGFQGQAGPGMPQASQMPDPPIMRSNDTTSPAALSMTLGDEAKMLGSDVSRVKDAIAAMSRLQGLGLERYDIPVPKCVVLGEQSTGKSSVIEAISGIRTPRADGTCTRCPLFIRLEDRKDLQVPVQAEVYLRKSYNYVGRRGGRSNQKFPGWDQAPQPIEEHFASTSSPAELEDLIARAQLATLNISNAHSQTFRQGPLDVLANQQGMAQFSPNCVCIYVSAPHLPSLSFYDLPGIIGQSEDPSTQYLVKFVRDLVTDYVRDSEALILVTCALDNDIHNSTAAGIAREWNATGRCVGVLTKPDCLPAGSKVEKLLDLLNERKFPLGHGYFVVKNLSQDKIECGMSSQHARAEEKAYFQTIAPWVYPQFQEHKGRYGIPNLSAYLSKQLAGQTLSAIPRIREMIDMRLSSVDKELRTLPEPPNHNASYILQDALRGFTREIELEIEGDPDYNTWRNVWEDLQRRFNESLMQMKPRLRTRGRRDKGISRSSGKFHYESIVIDSDDGEDREKETPVESPSKKRKLDTKNGYGHLGKTFDLDEIAARLKVSSKSRIPDELNPRVLDKLIIETMEHWERPMNDFFKELQLQLKGHLRIIYERHFIAWRDAAVFASAWEALEELFNYNFEEQASLTAPLVLDDEKKGPYIFFKDVWHKEKLQVEELYAQSRRTQRLRIYFDELDANTGKTTTPAERENKAKKDEHIKSLINQEPYAVELGVVAKITSYYQLASRRFHDSICMRIESKFFDWLKNHLLDGLSQGLDIKGPHCHENSVKLLADNSIRAARRSTLMRERDSLTKGKQELGDLEERYGLNGPMSSLSVSTPIRKAAYKHQAYVSTPTAEEEEI